VPSTTAVFTGFTVLISSYKYLFDTSTTIRLLASTMKTIKIIIPRKIFGKETLFNSFFVCFFMNDKNIKSA
jgi:hypothetical protein